MPRHSTRTPDRRTLRLGLALLFASATATRADEPPPRTAPLEWLKKYPERFIRRIKPVEDTLDSPGEIEEMQKRVRARTFDGNEEKRDEEVDISRPLKQAGLAVGDGQVEIVRTFLAFQAAESIRKGPASLAPNLTKVAGETLRRMGAGPAKALAASLAKSSWGTKLAQNLGASTFRGLMARESNFALIALINTLLIWGFYDGLDVDSFKDQVDAATALMHDHTPGKYLPGIIAESFVSRTMYDVFEKRWNVLYDQALKHRSGAGRLLKSLDEAVAATGQRMLKANRTGQAVVQAVNPEESLAKKMGLVGVGEGTALTLSGLAGRFFVGAGMATVGSLGVDTLTTFITGMSNRTTVGGNRARYYGKADVNSYQLQKTGNRFKDWWHERALSVQALWDNKVKWPIRTVMGPTAALVGAYLGSVAAGALIAGTGAGAIVGGTLISTLFGGLGEFVGSWVATKMDRSKPMMAFRRLGYEKMIRREIEGMPMYSEGRLTEDDLDRIARDRALDLEKMESTGFDAPQFYFVDSIDSVRLFEKGGYIRMEIADENGRAENTIAHIRYLVLDMEGRRAQFDIKQQKMVYVGREVDNNGKDIVFVDRAHVLVEDGRIVNQEDQGLYVFKNGNIMEKKAQEERQLTPEQRAKPDSRKEEWVIRGHAASRDLFIRETGQRFAFQDGIYHLVDTVGAEPEAAPVEGSQDVEPLTVYFPAIEADSGEDVMRAALVRQSQVALQQVTPRLDALLAATADPAKLEPMLVEAGALDPDGEPAAALREALAREDGADLVRTRVQRFIERLGTTVGQALPQAPRDTLAAEIQEITAAKHSATGPAPAYAESHERMQRSTIWGSLSLLGRPECLLVAAFDPAFGS